MIDDTLLWVRSWQLCLQVLLGEGYYAERTSKQTVEILDRRGKALESQVDSLKAMMKDLKAEVSFFDATAAEAVVSFWILSFRLLVTYYYNLTCPFYVSTYLGLYLLMLPFDAYNRKDLWRSGKIMLRKVLQRGWLKEVGSCPLLSNTSLIKFLIAA